MTRKGQQRPDQNKANDKDDHLVQIVLDEVRDSASNANQFLKLNFGTRAS